MSRLSPQWKSQPATAPNWEYSVIAKGFARPRSILFDSEGALIVIDTLVGIIHLQLDDSDAGGRCIRVSNRTTLIKRRDLTHGLAISEDGRTIYASSVESVFAFSYDPKKVTLDKSSEKILVSNMSSEGQISRNLLVSKKHPDMLLVSRGNVREGDPRADDLSYGQSQIRAFNISSFRNSSGYQKPYSYANDGIRLGWGLRNAVGVAEHPETGGIFSVDNSYENLYRDGKDIHMDNPAEELNFHGYLNGSTENRGGNYGYPFCYALWSTDKFPGLGDLKTGDHFSPDRKPGRSRRTNEECRRDYVAPVLAFQAHNTPLDLIFNQNGTRAYITFHGSWDRSKAIGYNVAYIDFKNGQPVFNASQSINATKPIIFNKNNGKCPDRCFRPVSLAWDSKNRLFFSSDKSREIFVLYYNGTTQV
ncbi:hypothetical protein FGADI_5010 [Fusarium gaditjirri]|uniref:Pyrroloquinoline quinone-dependent pyranose dehydrogenase beta-propeller domain-containing protein n=1 Tax=Fusarium gaditjirri TaxID=282569 RepID=A0A8H4WYM9_9HYPO|nr:hypothetical protein FGADI_5010 [Fusarium gaditjirri]